MAQDNGSDAIILARVVDGFFVDIPRKCVLVSENKLTKGARVHSKSGLGINFSLLYFNTIVSGKVFVKHFDQEKFDSKDMPEVRITPLVTMEISNPRKFYDQICGRNVSNAITVNSPQMQAAYANIINAVRRIIKSCEFKDIGQIDLVTRTNSAGDIEYIKSFNMSIDVYKSIVATLPDILDIYGIKILKIEFKDITKSEIIQKAEEDAKKADRERETAIKDADVKAKIAKKEAEAEYEKRIKEIAALKLQIAEYKKLGFNDEQIKQMIMMEKSNGAAIIYGGESSVGAMMAAQMSQNRNNDNNHGKHM